MCMYSAAAEHVNDVIKENINIVKEHEDYCQTDAIVSSWFLWGTITLTSMPPLGVCVFQKFDSQMTKGDELREQGRIKDCIGQYTTTVNLWWVCVLGGGCVPHCLPLTLSPSLSPPHCSPPHCPPLTLSPPHSLPLTVSLPLVHTISGYILAELIAILPPINIGKN